MYNALEVKNLILSDESTFTLNGQMKTVYTGQRKSHDGCGTTFNTYIIHTRCIFDRV